MRNLHGCTRRDPSPDNTYRSYTIRFLDDPGPVKINLRPAAYYTTSSVAIYGSWCL